MPIPDQVNEHLTMDFITSLRLSQGNFVTMVIIDNLTKFAHCGALPFNATAQKASQMFTNIVVKIHGFAKTLISDRDPIFLRIWQCSPL